MTEELPAYDEDSMLEIKLDKVLELADKQPENHRADFIADWVRGYINYWVDKRTT